jgi:hypothetical protein
MEIMIAVILISLIATAYLNFRAGQSDPLSQGAEDTARNSFVEAALEEIGYHICFARQQSPSVQPLIIDEGPRSDRIIVLHNNIRYEYFVDSANNLIRRQGTKDNILASDIQALKATRIGSQTMVITITTGYQGSESLASSGAISRSFSTVVAANGLM